MIRTITTLSLVLALTACTKDQAADQAPEGAKVTETAAARSNAARAEANPLSLDALLDKHFTALGGADKLRKVQTLTYGGKKYHDGKSVEITKYLKRGNKLRIEKNDGDTSYVMAFNGKKGWKQAGEEVKELPEEKLGELAYDASIDDALLVYGEKGYEVRLVGMAEIKGKPAYHVELIPNEHLTENRYIDAASYFEVKREVAWKDEEGKPHSVSVYFSDYRDVGDGLMVNHRVDYDGEKGEGKFVIEHAAFDKPLDDAKFELGGNIM